MCCRCILCQFYPNLSLGGLFILSKCSTLFSSCSILFSSCFFSSLIPCFAPFSLSLFCLGLFLFAVLSSLSFFAFSLDTMLTSSSRQVFTFLGWFRIWRHTVMENWTNWQLQNSVRLVSDVISLCTCFFSTYSFSFFFSFWIFRKVL